MWPVGTLVRLINEGKLGHIPHKRFAPYAILKMRQDGMLPQHGQEAIIVAKSRQPGWYMVQYDNLDKRDDESDIVVVAINRIHFRKLGTAPLPEVTYRVTKRRVKGEGIQVGDKWIRGVDKKVKK